MPFIIDMMVSRKGRTLAAVVGVGDADARANENKISLWNNGHGEAKSIPGRCQTYNQLNNSIMRKTYPDTGVGRA